MKIIVSVCLFLGLLNLSVARVPAAPEIPEAELQVKNAVRDGKILLSVQGSVLLSNGSSLMVSIRRFSGQDVERGQLIDVLRATVRDKKFECEKSFALQDLPAGIYFAWISRPDYSQTRSDNIGARRLFLVGTLEQAEKEYLNGSKFLAGVFEEITALQNLIENTVLKIEKNELDQAGRENIVRDLARQQQKLETMRSKISSSAVRTVHLDSITICNSQIPVYTGLIDAYIKKTRPVKETPVEGGETIEWSLPEGQRILKQMKDIFNNELLMKMKLEAMFEFDRLLEAGQQKDGKKIEPVLKETEWLTGAIKEQKQLHFPSLPDEKTNRLKEILGEIKQLGELYLKKINSPDEPDVTEQIKLLEDKIRESLLI